MQVADLTLLKTFYQSLKDHPLSPDDPEYVPYVENGEDADPIATMARDIDWSEGASVNLLSGQRGSGKSTQLRRLEKLLDDQGCVVFRCDMSD